MRTIIWFLYFWLYLILVLPEYWRVCRMGKQGKTEQHNRLVRTHVNNWAGRLLRLAGADITTTGKENIPQGPVVFVANHQGYFDIPLMLTQLDKPNPLVAKKEIRTHVNNWAGRLLRLAGADITTTGKENIPQGPVVFVANHQGYFDIPLMLTQLDKPNPLVAKKEIQKIPMIRGWMEQLHCVFLDRDDPRQSMECLRQAQELLGQGYSVVIFPEGTRNSGGPLGEFKAGAIRMATRAGVPVVPVCIDGSHLLMKKGSLWIHPAKVNIRILPPISTEGMARDEIRALPEQLRRQISDELDRLHS